MRLRLLAAMENNNYFYSDYDWATCGGHYLHTLLLLLFILGH